MSNTDVGLGGPAASTPRGVGVILGDAFDLYQKNAVLLIVTAAIVMGPVYIVKDAILAVALAPLAMSGFDRDGLLQAVASWVGRLFVPERYTFLHLLMGDVVSIAVLPIPIIGLVLLYQDILRSRIGVTDAQMLAQREQLLARG